MKFSLVLGTLGRTREVGRFLASLDALDAQSHREFELIVVDQNPDNRLLPLLAPYGERFAVIHLRSEPGLSRARNVGLQQISGEVIAFPDDDCWYPAGLLGHVGDQLLTHGEWDGITGRSVDEQGAESAFSFGREAALLDRFNVWARAISYTIFLRRATVEQIGPFDETLGLGAGTIFGSGEETDYMLRALQLGHRIVYAPELTVHHPDPEKAIDERVLKRAYAYGCGMGRVLAKHRYPLWFKARALVRPLGGALLSLSGLKATRAALHWNKCIGRLRGLRVGSQ